VQYAVTPLGRLHSSDFAGLSSVKKSSEFPIRLFYLIRI